MGHCTQDLNSGSMRNRLPTTAGYLLVPKAVSNSLPPPNPHVSLPPGLKNHPLLLSLLSSKSGFSLDGRLTFLCRFLGESLTRDQV